MARWLLPFALVIIDDNEIPKKSEDDIRGLPELTFSNYSRVNNDTIWLNGEEHFAIDVQLIGINNKSVLMSSEHESF